MAADYDYVEEKGLNDYEITQRSARILQKWTGLSTQTLRKR